MLGHFRLKKPTQEDLTSVYKYLIKRYEVYKARLFTVIPNEWTSGKGYKLKYWVSPFKLKKNPFTVRAVKYLTGCSEQLWNLQPWRYSKPNQTVLSSLFLPLESQRNLD